MDIALYEATGMQHRIIILWLVNVVSMCTVNGQSQNVLDERPISMSARAAAMADAATAETFDVSALYWNPGAMSFLQTRSIMVDHFNDWSSGGASVAIAAPIQFPGGDVVALGASLSRVSDRRTTPQPGRPTVQDGVDLGYAHILAPGLSLGARLGVRYAQEGVQSVATGSWMAGLSYAPSPEISYGIVYGEAGTRIVEADSQMLAREEMPQRLQVGIIMRYPSSLKHRLMTLAIANEKIFGRVGLNYKAGFELCPLSGAALRIGYVVGPQMSEFRYGAGITLRVLEIDYGIAPAGVGPHFQQISASIIFD